MGDEGWYARFPADEQFVQRQQTILRDGLPCLLFPERAPDHGPRQRGSDLLWVRVEPAPGWTHLADVPPTTPYHLSLCYEGEVVDPACWTRLAQRAGELTVLRVVDFGSGGTANLDLVECPLGRDPDVAALHAGGWYCRRSLHISM